MSDFKFRGIRVDNGEWIHGSPIIMNHTDGRHSHFFIIPFGASMEYGTLLENILVEVIPETIGIFTGKHDRKQNKEFPKGQFIYQGDKVVIEKEDADEVFIVQWDNDTARIILCGSTYVVDFDNYNGTDCEVIGNIHEGSENV